MSEIRQKMMLEDNIRMEMLRILNLTWDDGVLLTDNRKEVSYDSNLFIDFKDKFIDLSDNRFVGGVYLWGDLCIELLESEGDDFSDCEALNCSEYSVETLKQVLTILTNYGN